LSFGLALGAVLLATTKIETMAVQSAASGGPAFDLVIIRIISVIAVAVVILYYIFIKADSSF
jgi:hypothetical protein